jgi:phosphatidylserine/phosphatidylglycerophosphate/cardiolipin synthase-like enzyme
MVEAMLTATGPEHFIYLLGWWMSDDFAVSNGLTLATLFNRASDANVMVRVMLWDQAGTQNSGEVERINKLRDGAAILDNRTLDFGSHHQKVLIVNGSKGLIAFCGGVDFKSDRIMTVSSQPGSPLHDVHCQIEGPAASDLLRVFVQRWTDHPDHVTLDKQKGGLRSVTEPGPIADAAHTVQIGRTYGNGNAHAGIDSEAYIVYQGQPPTPVVMHRPRGYTFLNGRAGEQTAKTMLLKAIQKARQFIYLEDQYLVDLDIRNALVAAVPSLAHLTILIPLNTDLPQNHFRRQEFIRPLRAAAGAKLRVFHRPADKPYGYTHAKTWVFDDQYAIVGSANCNRRGYTHDSEVVAGILDEGPLSDIGFAQALRVALWANALGIDPGQLVDGVGSADTWFAAAQQGRVQLYDENANIETIHSGVAWNTVEDPDGS